MPSTEAQRKWMKENTIVFSIKLMKRTEGDIINYLETMSNKGVRRGTIFKAALREYMANHPEEKGE